MFSICIRVYTISCRPTATTLPDEVPNKRAFTQTNLIKTSFQCMIFNLQFGLDTSAVWPSGMCSLKHEKKRQTNRQKAARPCKRCLFCSLLISVCASVCGLLHGFWWVLFGSCKQMKGIQQAWQHTCCEWTPTVCTCGVSHHNIVSLDLCLLCGQFLTFQF